VTNVPVDFTPWLGAFETLRVVRGVPLFVAEHRKELARALEVLGLHSDADFEQSAAALPALSGRWRWIVTCEGTRTLFSEGTAGQDQPVSLTVSDIRVGSVNWDARFKTISYLSHMQAWQTGRTPEVVLLNERGEIASVSRGNIFWRKGDRLFTPAHEAGCRCGVVRGWILKQKEVETGHFAAGDLLQADEIFLTNSMKGIVSADQVEGAPLRTFSCANELRGKYAEAVEAELRAHSFRRGD
jgi:branched-subunit amino acid aminotransferase/4-amino-4-deoxychorismate lyase